MASHGNCINHPGIEAAARCKMCTKPVCSSCRVMGPTGAFCSPACKEKHEAFIKRTHDMETKQKSSGVRLAQLRNAVGGLVVLFVVAVAVGFIANLYDFHIPILSDFVVRLREIIGV